MMKRTGIYLISSPSVGKNVGPHKAPELAHAMRLVWLVAETVS